MHTPHRPQSPILWILLAAALGCGSSSHRSVDASTGADAAVAPTFVGHFDKSQGQLPEGLWLAQGTPIVSWAPLSTVLDVAADGTTHPLGMLGTATNTFTLGIVGDASGTLYVGVGAAAAVGAVSPTAQPVTPPPGVYKIPAAGGSATAFSLGTSASPAMGFANGLALHGATLFVADSEGVIYKIDDAGAASAWSQDPLLAPSQPACGGVVPLAVGANGIVVGPTDVYVTNTNFGRLVRIPIGGDGRAGAAHVVAEDCAQLAGADGLAQDVDGSFLIAVNAQNRIARVSASGQITILAQGAPLDTPASVLVDTTTTPRRLLITNSSFFSPAGTGMPGLLAMPLP